MDRTFVWGFACLVFIALTGGNFFWQWMTERDWEAAVERSYFQGVALALMTIGLLIDL